MNAKYVAPPVKEIGGYKVKSLTLSQDVEVVHSITPVADPDWVYRDHFGHHHFWDDPTGYPTLPTLEWVVTSTHYCELCRDHHEEGEYRCKRCGEVVKPGTRSPNPSGTPIAMPAEVHLEVIGNGPEVLRGEVEGKQFRFQKIGVSGEVGSPISEYVGVKE